MSLRHNSRQGNRDEDGQRNHHQEADDGDGRRTLSLLTDICPTLPERRRWVRYGRIEPIERLIDRRACMRMRVQQVAILRVQKKLKERMAVGDVGAAAIINRDKQEANQRQTPKWRYPAR